MKWFLSVLGGFVSFLIIDALGALFFWLVGGRKTKFYDELIGHGWFRNEIVGGIIIAVVLLVVLIILGKF